MEDEQAKRPDILLYIGHYLPLIKEREEQLGHPAEDGPSYKDMAYLYRLFVSIEQMEHSLPPSDVNAAMRHIEGVLDSWLEPELDPIGKVIYPVLDQVHANLGELLDKAVPESAELRRRQADLRALDKAIRRRMAHQKPSLFSRLAKRLKRES